MVWGLFSFFRSKDIQTGEFVPLSYIFIEDTPLHLPKSLIPFLETHRMCFGDVSNVDSPHLPQPPRTIIMYKIQEVDTEIANEERTQY